MFTLANWGCQQPSMNAGQETVTPFGGSPTVENTINVFTYKSPNDAVATIVAANYFLPQWKSLSVGDIIWGSGTDASFAVQVTAVSATTVTVVSMGLTTSIGTANIVDDAVTYAKLQDAVADNVLLGNPGGGAGAEYVEVPLGNGLSFAAGSLQLLPSYLNVVAVNMTAAQWNGMEAAPFQLLAAPGAGLMNVVEQVIIDLQFVSAQFANGGAVGLQYGATPALAGPAASSTEAAADFNAAAASTVFQLSGGLGTGAPVASAANAAITISNDTAPFITGDSTFTVYVAYRTVAVS